jgi:hypothetical protein
MKILIIKIFNKIKFLIQPIFNLNQEEIKGNINTLTLFKLRFIDSVNLSFKNGRTNRGIKFNNEEFIYSGFVKSIIQNQNDTEIIKNLLKEFKSYENLKILDINGYFGDSEYKSMPLWNMVTPWDKTQKEKFLKKDYLNQFYKNRTNHKLNFQDNFNDSILSKLFSKDSALSQYHQFKNLLKKIKKEGYKDDINDLPVAVILIKGKRWIWMIESGNHRAYIKHEMSYPDIKCRIKRVINFKNISTCHNVKNGIFSVKEAEAFFETVFEGLNIVRGII